MGASGRASSWNDLTEASRETGFSAKEHGEEMSGCSYMEKSFSVAASRGDSRNLCEKCDAYIKGSRYKKNGVVMCRECFDASTPDKEIGASVDNFTPYYDQQLGTKITSLRQKVKLLEKKGLHYSEDNPKTRELCKMAKSFLGENGTRQLDPKGKAEFERVSQKMARKVNYGR